MNSNPNNLETRKEFYVSGETKLFVNKNGKMTPAVFDSFDRKNGKDVIYLICDGKRCFYYFPDSKYVFLNKDDCNVAVSKATRKAEVVSLTGRIVSAFNKFPAAKKPVSDFAEENERESRYHFTVNKKLSDDRAEPERVLAEEADNIRTLNEEYAQTAKNAYEDGGFVDEHTMISFDLHKKLSERNRSFANDEIRRIEEIRKQPYFARVDCGKSLESLHTAYIGETEIDGLVVDWRNSQVGNAYYHTEILSGRDDAIVALKRRFDIKNAVFNGFYDELNAYSDNGEADITQDTINSDEMLTQLLAEAREDKQTHDIIKTIQSEQYDIITSDFNQNAVINGCAGSGKTMIMYHRLSYMAYNYETYTGEEFIPENVYVVSPSSYFDVTNNSLLKKLSIKKINQSPLGDLLDKLISEYCKLHGIVPLQGLSLYLNAKNESGNDFFTKKAYSYFSSQVKDINFRSSYRDEYKKWVVALANRFLEIAGFDTISFSEFSETPSDVFLKFDSNSYYRNPCFEKTRKDRNGNDVQYGYFNKNAITGISFENIIESLELSSDDSETYKKRKRRFERNQGILKACLSIKTKRDSKGNVSTNISDFWNLLEKSEVFEKMLSVVIAEKLLHCISDTTHNQDLILKCLFVYEKTISSNYAKDISLYILRVLSDNYGCIIDDKSFVFIDEFQNYSAFELKCLDEAFLDPVYNLYGDFDQRIDDKGVGLKNDLDSLISPNTYNININYRNAKPITEFINRKVHKNMHPIGVDGRVSEKELKECPFEVINRTAIIAKDTELALHFLKKHIDVSRINNISKTKEIIADKFNLMNVSESKGLEFDTVYVIDFQMSDNEKYVAFTRALDFLVVINDDLNELKKIEEQQKKEEARLRREEKKKLKELSKLAVVLKLAKEQISSSTKTNEAKDTSEKKKVVEVVIPSNQNSHEDKTPNIISSESNPTTTDSISPKPKLRIVNLPKFQKISASIDVDKNNGSETKLIDESKEAIYKIAVSKHNNSDIESLTESIVLLATIIDYKDSAQMIELIREKISSVSKIEARKKLYREQKKCQYCGGSFKGLFKLKCKTCGKPKDY